MFLRPEREEVGGFLELFRLGDLDDLVDTLAFVSVISATSDRVGLTKLLDAIISSWC